MVIHLPLQLSLLLADALKGISPLIDRLAAGDELLALPQLLLHRRQRSLGGLDSRIDLLKSVKVGRYCHC